MSSKTRTDQGKQCVLEDTYMYGTIAAGYIRDESGCKTGLTFGFFNINRNWEIQICILYVVITLYGKNSICSYSVHNV